MLNIKTIEISPPPGLVMGSEQPKAHGPARKKRYIGNENRAMGGAWIAFLQPISVPCRAWARLGTARPNAG